ncbi:S46 family peptidase [Candidatus Laterigemmans baculatus]|uniref:S46 family peptidase n=1 Tax=Candidatus Laterigemmans baculatus TaxID=2770505 RepID=UPI0013DD4934|nr:S46 family peptidase [Candidatus Laterigemmans baculatus]
MTCCLTGSLNLPRISQADEGMWLFNELPRQLLKERHDFDATEPWAQNLMLASVRFNSGGSGSFVSSDGLVLTNHHVASDTLFKLSTPERNIMEEGYLARTREEELKAPDLELNQLVEIIDVTERVAEAVTGEMEVEEAAKARRGRIAEIEKESLDQTGLRSDVITLYGGARYHLYRYKKFTDVRLVWAPETKAAFFGGDADNFEYPRYNLDATLVRVYEDGEPAKIEHFLKWSDTPATDGDLVFVSGNPGRTQRIFTVAALKYLRDHRLPYVLDYLRRKEIMLQQFGLEGPEQKRRARDELFGIQNSRKAYTGMLAGLQAPVTFEVKQRREKTILERIAADPELKDLASAWETVASLQDEQRAMLGEVTSFRSRLYEIAQTLNLMAAEDAKPNNERLREFGQAGRESLMQDLLSEAPIYEDLEQAKLADEIAYLVERRGGDDPLVAKVLEGKGPAERAAELVEKTNLADVAVRKQLAEGGATAIEASDDPLIALAKIMEPAYREARQRRERVEEELRQAYAKITEATVAVEGTGNYPDATFTLRLAFGLVSGYQEDGRQIPPSTDFEGAFAHAAGHDNEGDWELPQSWYRAKDELDLSTQLNFVCTADIIGGNSGSPVVDREGALVGLIFDGNIQSLSSDYLYSDVQARAVSVSGVGIREAIKTIYNAPELAASLGK